MKKMMLAGVKSKAIVMKMAPNELKSMGRPIAKHKITAKSVPNQRPKKIFVFFRRAASSAYIRSSTSLLLSKPNLS